MYKWLWLRQSSIVTEWMKWMNWLVNAQAIVWRGQPNNLEHWGSGCNPRMDSEQNICIRKRNEGNEAWVFLTKNFIMKETKWGVAVSGSLLNSNTVVLPVLKTIGTVSHKKDKILRGKNTLIIAAPGLTLTRELLFQTQYVFLVSIFISYFVAKFDFRKVRNESRKGGWVFIELR